MAAVSADEAGGSEMSIQPSVSVSEGYDDNIFLSPVDRVDDYITRVIPAAKFSYRSPFWDWDVAYAYDYRLYAYRTVVDDSTQRFNLTNRTNIIKEFLLLDVREVYDRTSLTPVRDYTEESISVNQTDRNIFTASPYVLLRPSTDTSVKAGYQYRSLWYKDPGTVDKEEHGVYGEGAWELSPRTALTAGVRYSRTETNKLDYFRTDTSTGTWTVNYQRTDLSIGAKYEYAEGSFLNLTIGNTWFSPENPPEGVTWLTSEIPAERASQVFWNFEINRKFPTYALSFTTALNYVDDPAHILRREDRYVLSFRKETERATLGASAGLWEYRQVATNYLEALRYRTTASLGYSFTPALKLAYNLTIERFEDKTREALTGQEEYTTRYLNAVRFDYLLSESVTLSVDYRYTNNYAPHSYNENYYNNRIMLELTKKF